MFKTVVKLPRLLRTLGDFGDKRVSGRKGTSAAIDTGDNIGDEAT